MLRAAVMVGLFLTLARAAHAQCRLEGTVVWADGSPAAGLTVSIREPKLQTTTDARGQYGFDNVKAGIRVAVTIALGQTLLATRYTLVTLWVEQVDVALQGTPDHPNPAPPPPVRVTRVAPPIDVSPGNQTDPGSAVSDITSFSADGAPTLSAEVTVTASLPMLSPSIEAGKVRLAPEQVESLPSLGTRDIFRALQFLPGVSANETSSGLFVRGGTPDQNLVDYDGFTVYSVDHLFGYFSAFNMGAIEDVALSKGGYDARYGGRLSSLTEIHSRTSPKNVRGSISGSLLSGEGVVEVPMGESASFLVGARRSFQGPLYNRILGLVNSQTTPAGPGGAARPGGGPFAAQFDTQPKSSFDDMNGRFDWRPGSHDQVAISGYQGHDNLDNSRDFQLPADLLQFLKDRGITPPSGAVNVSDVRAFRNVGASGRWTREWFPRVRSIATVAYSTYETTTTRGTNAGGRNGSTGETNTVADTNFRLDVPIQVTPTSELTVGFQQTANRVRYDLQNVQALQAGDTTSQSPNLTSQLNRDTAGELTALFAQYHWVAGSRFVATPGVRVTRFSQTGERYVEPRLSATLLATNALRFKGAWGQYHQFVSKLTREDVLQGNREFWAMADGTTIPVSTATNMSGGATFDTGHTMVDAEVFVRRLSNLTQLVPRTTGSTGGLDLSQFFYQGQGRVRGLEALVQKKIGRHTGLASYTLSRVLYDFPEFGTFPADHDRTHELKLVDTFQLGPWALSATWIFSTGVPYTEPTGTETIAVPSPQGDRTFSIERVLVGDRNGARLPAYHRLDAAANHLWRIGDHGQTATLGLSVFNAYNRQNVWYREFTSVGGQILENNINLMGLTLNASFTVKF